MVSCLRNALLFTSNLNLMTKTKQKIGKGN